MGQPTAEKMQCMEVWGGNRATWSQFGVPGLDVWLYSEPLETNSGGGDVYYLSSCASGRITRMLLADVSGHGAEASPVAVGLRDMMRKNVNIIDQSRMAEALNNQFGGTERFATALMSTFFSPTRSLSMASAGHPPALVFRKKRGEWRSYEDETTDGRNMPIGVLEDTKFTSGKIKLDVGDLVLCYTDAMFEAKNQSGEMLKSDGLLDLVRQANPERPETIVPEILDRLRELNPENLNGDDVTVMLARANGTGVSLKDNLLAPVRLLARFLGLEKKHASTS